MFSAVPVHPGILWLILFLVALAGGGAVPFHGVPTCGLPFPSIC